MQRLTASTVIAEIGDDRSRFPSSTHLSSWAGVAPGNKQSGGKRLSAPTTTGNTHLRAALAEAGWAISHTKDNSLSAQYHRLARRIGKQKAIVAVSHSLLVIISHLFRDQSDYRDLGSTSFLIARQSACGVFRVSLHGDAITETLGKLFHSYNKPPICWSSGKNRIPTTCQCMV